MIHVKRMLTLTLMASMLLLLGLVGTAAAADKEYKVMLNGTYVSFTDVQPQNIDGRVMVPFRAILETLGAEVSWDSSTKTITAQKDDTKISFAMGQSDITVEENGQTRTLHMDAVPFVGDGRTYVGTRFMAEAFGYKVGWDAANSTVVLVDFAQIFASADEDFSILVKAMQSDEDYMNKTYKTNAEYKLGIALAEALTGAPMELSATGTMESVQKGMEADMTLKLAMNLADLVGEAATEEDLEALAFLENITIDMKVDGASGDIYMNSELFSMMNEEYDENTWLKTNGYASYEQMGVDITKVVDLTNRMETGDASLYETLMFLMDQSAEAMTVDTYQNVKTTYDILKGLLGDEAFTTKSSGNQTIYTNQIVGTDVFKEIAKNVPLETLMDSMTMEDQNELNDLLKNINLTLIFTEEEGKIVASAMDIQITLPEMTINMATNSTQTSGTMTMVMDVPEMMTLNFNMDMDMQETTQKVNISLPANAKVVDMDAMISIESSMIEE